MADSTPIEWTDATWNPITGCTLVDQGCRHCYAARLAATRLRNHPSRQGLARMNAVGVAQFTGEVRLNEQWLDQPLRWKRPRRIFVCAHADLFHESVPDVWIDRVFAVMALAPQHTFQVLTKRPERMREYMTAVANHDRHITIDDDGSKFRTPTMRHRVHRAMCDLLRKAPASALNAASDWQEEHFPDGDGFLRCWPLPNVWLGTSVSDQTSADQRIPYLLETRAAVRFLSAEPLLGPLDIFPYLSGAHQTAETCWEARRLNWVIVGGESGPGARPMHPDWARSLRDQCVNSDVAFFFKQWGLWAPCEIATPGTAPAKAIDVTGRLLAKSEAIFGGQEPVELMSPLGKSRAGRLLDGRTWDQMPGVG